MKSITLKRMSAIAAITILAAMLPRAYAALQIYKVKGNVTIKSKAKTVKAERRATVAPTDLLSIPAGDAVDILDSESHRIYSSIGYGKMTVKTMIEKAESQASDITRNINRKVIAAVADNAANNRNAYEAMGMAIHETDVVVGPPVLLPECMTYLSYLIDNSTDPDDLHQCRISLRLPLTDPEETDSSFCFAVNNSTDQPLYFNIIEKGIGKDLHFLLPQNPVAAPKEETVISEYIFIPDSATKGYIAVASDKDFTNDDIWNLLDPGYEATDEFYLTVFTK